MDYNKLCLGCFRENKSCTAVCPSCGFDEKEYNRKAAKKMCLPAGTILQGKYLIGKMLGAGGFGITYLAFQLNLDRVVAIKEFFPSSIAVRGETAGSAGRNLSIRVSGAGSSELFEKTLSSFEKEGKNLASINLPGVVGIYDCFRENFTAYLVMEYISGQNLKKYQETKGGKLEEKEILELLEPVIRSMARIHELGIIHRDISPENLILNSEGKLILVDFGAARSMAGLQDSEGKSLTVVLKQGYAPLEQYNSRGVQGPWTDVYALCATIYRLLTGKTPEEVSIRIQNSNDEEDTRRTLLKSGASRKTVDAVTAGMKILYQDRIQKMPDLWKTLYGESAASEPETGRPNSRPDSAAPAAVQNIKKDSKSENKNTKPLLLVVLLAGAIGAGSFLIHRNMEARKAAEKQEIERVALEKAESERIESERIAREEAESEKEKVKEKKAYIDGIYNGTGNGGEGEMEVTVVVENGKIHDIVLVEGHSETPGIYEMAVDQVIPAIIEAQSTDVDSASGATMSSTGIKEAVEEALSKAEITAERKEETETKDSVAASPDIEELISVDDMAGLLSDQECDELYELAKKIALKYHTDIRLVTTNDTGGKSSRDFTDDFFESKTKTYNGACCCIDMDNREFYLTTEGTMIPYLNDNRRDRLLDNVSVYIASGDYAGTFRSMLSDINKYMEEGIEPNTVVAEDESE